MANPFTVQPLGGLQNIQMIDQGMQGIAQNVQAARQEEQLAQAQQAVSEALRSGDVNAIRQAMIQYPEMAEQAKNAFGFTNEQTERVARETYRRVLSDPENAPAYMQQGIQQVAEFGGRPTMMMQDLQMLQESPEAALQNIRAGYAALASEEEFGAMFGQGGGPDAPSNVREYQFWKELDPEQQREYMRVKRASQGFREGDVQMVQDPVRPELAQPVRGVGQGPTTQEEQQERLTRQQAEQAASKEAATQAIKTSKEAFDQIRPIKTAIANVDEAIRLIDEGANTGVIASKLPSVQEASIALDNLQGRLGLDVIGNTTFGALSQAELEFALNTALPKNLEGPALKRWLQDKQESQKKLAEYLEDAATFLGKPGNTIADFIEKQRQKGSQPRRIRLDAQGNIIQ